MRKSLLITALLTAIPAAAAAQDGSARINASMQAAARAEIPTSLLESKVKEGRAKGIADARIASAVEARLEALLTARDALADAGVESLTAGELSVAADAVQVGVSQRALVDVITSAPDERRAVATAVLASLVQLGIASDQAQAQVHGALSGGAEALANLQAEVAARLRAGGQVPMADLSVAGAATGLVGGSF